MSMAIMEGFRDYLTAPPAARERMPVVQRLIAVDDSGPAGHLRSWLGQHRTSPGLHRRIQ
ncbi:hypothetical protein [Streptomyces sp. S.PB5]|uniref:hypothetical protein n=1 Tax=Streptomyces sp. S.PB5 TaxID=3020844 RepID=UPI0025B1C6C9|nr:hypothetical protein [Streptomyces sp. S.PB5]MDN3022809.1 hypothetical protein [Streptomyces sp. S.PB5]